MLAAAGLRDGNLYTSAGITAGMHFALAHVEEDYGAQVALQIARELALSATSWWPEPVQSGLGAAGG